MVAAFKTVDFGMRRPIAPWYAGGVRIAGALTAKEALKVAGLDWTVDLQKVFVELDGRMVEFPGKRGVIRERLPGRKEAERFFEVRSDHFRPVQNTDAFSFFDRVVKRGEAMYHSAGSFYGGRVVFILAKLPSDIVVAHQDLIEQYVLLTNAHDGTRMLRMGYMPIIQRTQTVLGTAQSRRFSVSIRHMGANIDSRIAEARRALGIIKTWSDKASGIYTTMANHEVSSKDVDEYLKALFPDKEGKTLARVSRDAVRELAQAAAEITSKHQPISVWDLYQSTCQHLDTTARPATKMSSIWFGERARTKERAQALALKLTT